MKVIGILVMRHIWTGILTRIARAILVKIPVQMGWLSLKRAVYAVDFFSAACNFGCVAALSIVLFSMGKITLDWRQLLDNAIGNNLLYLATKTFLLQLTLRSTCGWLVLSVTWLVLPVQWFNEHNKINKKPEQRFLNK